MIAKHIERIPYPDTFEAQRRQPTRADYDVLWEKLNEVIDALNAEHELRPHERDDDLQRLAQGHDV